MVFPVVTCGCGSWTIKKAECQRIALCTVVLEKTPESPFDSKEIQPVNLKGNQPWVLIERTDTGNWSSSILVTCWIIKKAREFQKNIYFCFIDYAKGFVWVTTNCGKFFKRWEYQTIWSTFWEIRMQVRKQQLELDIEQQTDIKLGKEYIKAVYCHPAYLAYMQSTSCEMPGWMKHKLESRLLGEISITSDMQMTSPLWQKAKN